MDDSPSLTPTLALGKVGFLKDFFIAGSVTTVGTASIFGTVDVSGLEIEGLPTPVYENIHLEGETVVEGPIIFEDNAIFLDQLDATDALSFFGDQFWTDGSAIDVDGTVSFLGGGTIDFGAVNVINLPPPSFTDVTLLGNTTVDGPAQFNDDANFAAGTVLTTDDQIWNGDTIGVPGDISVIGAGSLDFQLDVALSGNTTSNGPFTFNDDASFIAGTTLTMDEQVWNGSTVTVAGSLSFVGGGTIDFGGVNLVNLPPPSFTDVTLLGNTTVDGPAQFNGNATFANGTTLTMDEQVWNGASISVPAAVAVSGVGSVSFSGLSSVTLGTVNGATTYNGNATYADGTTLTIDEQVWNGTTISVTNPVTFGGVGSLDISPLTLVTLGTTTANGPTTFNDVIDIGADQIWSAASSIVQVDGDVDFAGTGSIDFSGIVVTMSGVTFSGTTTFSGPLIANGTSTFNDAATFTNTVNVTGTTDLDGDLSVGGLSVFAGDVTIDPAADFTVENQFWTGATSSINVAGDVSFVGAAGASLSFSGIDVTGLHDLTLTGATTIAGTSLDVTSPTFGISAGTVINSSSTSTATFASTLTSTGLILSPKTTGAATELWANSAASNTLRYGTGNVLVNTAPTVANAIPVYTGTAGQVDTAATTTAATLARPLTVSAGNTSTVATFNTTNDNCFLNISTTGTNTNRGAVRFGRSAVGQWVMGSDKDNTNADNFFVFRSGAQALVINGTDQLITGGYGFSGSRYDVTAAAANPGGAGSIWADSTTSNSLRYGTGNVLVDPAPTVANAIPVYTGIGGQVDTTATSTPATLSRPFNIDAGNGDGVNNLNMCTFTSSVPTGRRALVNYYNTNAGNSSTAFLFGKPFVGGTSLTWEMGCDNAVNNTDDFYIRHNKTGILPIRISATDLVTLQATTSARYDVTASAANPGSTGTIWADSTTSNSLRYGAGNVLVDPAPTVANAIPVYTGTGGQVDNTQTATAAVLNRPLQLNNPAGALVGVTSIGSANGSRIVSSFSNINGTNHAAAVQVGGNAQSQRWSFGNDRDINGSDDCYIRRDAATPVYAIQSDVNGRVTTPNGHNSIDLTLTTSGVNPNAGATDIWLKSADPTRPRWGDNEQLALLSDIGDATAWTTITAGATIPIPADAVAIQAFLSAGGGGGGSGTFGSPFGGGGGGGSGEFAMLQLAVDNNTTSGVANNITFTIGAGGIGGTPTLNGDPAGNGANGGNTTMSVNGILVATAHGGEGGTPGGSGGSFGMGGDGGYGGGGGGRPILGGTGGIGGTSTVTTSVNGVTLSNLNGVSTTTQAGGRGGGGGGPGGSSTGSNMAGGGGGGPGGGRGSTSNALPATDGIYGGGGGGGGFQSGSPIQQWVSGANGGAGFVSYRFILNSP